ncbi:MAG: gamma carbonic anhydrase family protein [Euryarchaeota archaeon]|nr:gamma carbonic anhydrase family protein [Euryarchaeota archaeon]MBV1729069.1 gamma carbonic anhydrase family protein [Methanobacterium sp.]MBU4548314.1 gamma carbonic anhydrase family protein [Euryarchaeota archaeon]MBU4607007.1 gamma carbonic anhydrase family protein [Euryarchaeota archaeon]MBV1754814.1 gamma carbonic anhydrase family protein [Methanobacterium sp.]
MKKIHSSVRLFPGAHVQGKVEIDENSSVWYNAVVRGDIEPIKIGKYSNIQDNCVVHSSTDYPVKIGDYVSVGHAAVLHGCSIEENVLIGMNATVLNGAHIGKDSVVGAGAVVTEGKKFPAKSLIIGMPARLIKELNEEEIESIKKNALRYSALSHENP